MIHDTGQQMTAGMCGVQERSHRVGSTKSGFKFVLKHKSNPSGFVRAITNIVDEMSLS
jgi:hypothetical protein